MNNGKPNDIRPCTIRCGADNFENAIREFGVENAAEWFGHHAESDFVKETIEILRERSGLE